MTRPEVPPETGHPPTAAKPHPPHRLPKLILHAGSHKTGTTGIQFALSENRAHLRALGVWYPRVDEVFPVNPKLNSARGHLAFADAAARFTPRDRGNLTRFLRNVRRRADQYDRVLLSAESFYRMTAPAPLGKDDETEVEQRARFLDRLAALMCGFDSEILLYLRRVDRFASSLYAESIVRNTSTASFRYFLKTKTLRFDYRRQIDLFSLFFPVTVHNFEAAAKAGLVESFCAHAGIPGALPPTPERSRPSLSNPAVLWLLKEKRARKMDKKERRRRWHFALLPENGDLFDTQGKTGFWQDQAERDAFIEANQSNVPEVSFPEAGEGFEPLATWSDNQHADAERRFLAWQSANEARLKRRERAKIPPYALDP